MTGTASGPVRGRWGLRWRAALLAAALAAGVVVVGPGSAQAGSAAGTVPEVRLSSETAGELTVSWDAPVGAPSDYRVMWALASLDYLSWRAVNEAERGNFYPEGSETSLTLTGLTEGAVYKVRVRSRYRSGSNGPWGGPWSGPWTDEATGQVRSGAPAADPAGNEGGGSAVAVRDEPLLDPPTLEEPIAEDGEGGEDDEGLRFAAQSQAEPRHVETLVVTLVSSLDRDSGLVGSLESRGRFMSFTTGSSPDGYALTGVTVRVSGVGIDFEANASVLADDSGVPGMLLYAFPAQKVRGTHSRDVAFAGAMSLEPDTTYWLNLDSPNGPALQLRVTSAGAVDSGGLSGWSLGSVFHFFEGGEFRARIDAALAVRLLGTVSGLDFGFDASTLGRLGLG